MAARPARIATAAAVALGIALSSCAGGGGFPWSDTDAADPTTSTAPPTTQLATAPLTGLPVPAGADLARPALVFKVDDSDGARPQAGLEAADVVYQEVVEGGITRLMVVLHSLSADAVGPIRSVRPTDIDLMRPLGNSVLIFSGGQPKVLDMVRRAGLDTRSDEAGNPGDFRRDPKRQAPHNLFTSTGAFWQAGTDPAMPRAVAHYSAAPPAGGTPAQRAVARFSTETSTTWVFDPATARWVMQRRSKPALTASGAPVAFDNVVFLKVRRTDTGLTDVNEDPVPGWQTTGSGDLVLVRDGQVFRGQWSRASGASTFTLRGADGAAITLRPGNSWWALVPDDGTVEVS